MVARADPPSFRDGGILIASGFYDIGLVFGIEQMSNQASGVIPLNQNDLGAGQGMIMPALYALRVKRYMELYKTTKEQLALVSVKNHAHNVYNPKAQYQKNFSLEDLLNSPMRCDPLTLYQCCPTGDGAAAAILCDKELTVRFSGKLIYVTASVLTSGRSSLDTIDITLSDIPKRAAKGGL